VALLACLLADSDSAISDILSGGGSRLFPQGRPKLFG
jgi:hypothetical protein